MKILNKLVYKNLIFNKKRTVVTIIGVLLSTALMVGIGLLFSSFRNLMLDEVIESNGDHHISIIADKNDKELIENYKNIKSYYYVNYVGIYEYQTDDYYVSFIVHSADIDKLKKLNITGDYPKNNKEIIVSEYSLYGTDLKIGDTLKVNDNEFLIVGTYEYSSFISDAEAYTTNYDTDEYIYYIKVKNIKNIYDDISNFKSLGIYYKNIIENIELLELYGLSSYPTVMILFYSFLAVILTILMIGCSIVISNSFAISVSERKKQFGLYSSIGASKKQLKYTVYFEAFIVGIIGIVLGILSAYLGIGLLIKLINNLLLYDSEYKISLATYPLFIALPVLYMILTLFFSANAPARQASKSSPLESIRLNDDIKIKKNIKTPFIISKIFGVEGSIAFKNIKRNKKKYRITMLSLIVSIVLFITFSSIMKLIFADTDYVFEAPYYDVLINVNNDSKKSYDSILEDLSNRSDVKNYFTSKLIAYVSEYNDIEDTVIFDIVDDNTYNEYLKLIGKKDKKPIIYNNYTYYDCTNGNCVILSKTKLDKKVDITLCDSINYGNSKNCDYLFNDYYLTNDILEKLSDNDNQSIIIYLTKDMYNSLNISKETYFDDDNPIIYLKANNINSLSKYIENEYDVTNYDCKDGFCYTNVYEEYRLNKNLILIINIFVYGFISLVTLIGITSVINTINTSIALRRREFAILRSVGLTRNGFNKMIILETIFLGIKSLLYALPISYLIIWFIHRLVLEITPDQEMMIPYKQVLIAVIGVFVIILICMLYATKKIKKENILEAIKDENI